MSYNNTFVELRKHCFFLWLKFRFENRTTVKKNYKTLILQDLKIVGHITLLRILSVPRDVFYDGLWTSIRNSSGKLYQMIKSSLSQYVLVLSFNWILVVSPWFQSYLSTDDALVENDRKPVLLNSEYIRLQKYLNFVAFKTWLFWRYFS